MENRKILTKTISFITLVTLIGVAAALRLVPHAPNFTPIAAIALFGGVYLDRKLALIIPLLAMLISDVFLGFHQSMLFVYLSFTLTGCLGIWLKQHKSPVFILTASLFSAVLFYLLTNFGFWLSNSLYPKTLLGQLEAYYLALPFFRNTLAGDLFYTVLLFGGYEIVLKVSRQWEGSLKKL